MTHFVIVIRCFFLAHTRKISALWWRTMFFIALYSNDATIEKCNKKKSAQTECRREARETPLFPVDNDDNLTKYAIKLNQMLCCRSVLTTPLFQIWMRFSFWCNRFELRVHVLVITFLATPAFGWKLKNCVTATFCSWRFNALES